MVLHLGITNLTISNTYFAATCKRLLLALPALWLTSNVEDEINSDTALDKTYFKNNMVKPLKTLS